MCKYRLPYFFRQMIVFHLSGEKILESSRELFNAYESF